jgi:hypothetical protein
MAVRIAHLIEQVVAKAPAWIKTELISPDPGLRERAEETLAAMIAAALEEEAGTGEGAYLRLPRLKRTLPPAAVPLPRYRQ